MGRKGNNLTPIERTFVANYVAGEPGLRGRAHPSAIAAGASASDTAAGARLMARPLVRAEIERVYAKAEITTTRVLREIGRVAFSDMREYAGWGPNGVTLKASGDLPDDAAAAVAEVSEVAAGSAGGGGSLKFKLHDKIAALTTLAKHLKLIGNGHDEGAGRVAVIILDAGGHPLDINMVRQQVLAQHALSADASG